jgi:hypothetical protein
MRKVLLLPLLMLFFGCAQNHFNVPEENFADRVKVLGIAPIIVDVDSDIKHPQKEQLIALVTEMNRKYEPQFIRKLKENRNFYSVSALYGDPRAIFGSLLFRHEKRSDAAIEYNKYFWKKEELGDLIRKNGLDAVMLIVVSGLSKSEKISSSTLMTSLTSEYNYLIITAQILDANGTVLWEYPNFRGRLLSFNPMINLQYPDFCEAEANVSEKADVKFKTIEGIKRRFEVKSKDLLRRDTQESEVYSGQFDEMVSLLKFDPAKAKKAPAGELKSPTPAGQPRPAAAPAPAPAPVPDRAPGGSQMPAAADKPAQVDQVPASTDEIVPAEGSTK